MEINKEFLQKELTGIEEQRVELERTSQYNFQRLVGIKLYLEDLLKKIADEEVKLVENKG